MGQGCIAFIGDRFSNLFAIEILCGFSNHLSHVIGKRIEISKSHLTTKILTPSDLVHYFQPAMRALKKEVFKVVLLDSGNRIIKDVNVTQGTLNASLVHPREVFKSAIDFLAAGIVLVHNHPSGDSFPPSGTGVSLQS